MIVRGDEFSGPFKFDVFNPEGDIVFSAGDCDGGALPGAAPLSQTGRGRGGAPD